MNDYQTKHANLNSISKGEKKIAVYWSNKINLEKNSPRLMLPQKYSTNFSRLSSVVPPSLPQA